MAHLTVDRLPVQCTPPPPSHGAAQGQSQTEALLEGGSRLASGPSQPVGGRGERTGMERSRRRAGRTEGGEEVVLGERRCSLPSDAVIDVRLEESAGSGCQGGPGSAERPLNGAGGGSQPVRG